MMCRDVKWFSSIMNSQSLLGDGLYSLVQLSKVNRRRFVHLLSICRTSFTGRSYTQWSWTCVIFLLCSRSAKSPRLNTQASNRSISTCRQFLIIYEEVSNVVLIRKATHVTSFGSIPRVVPMNRSFSFLRRTISICKSFGWSIKSIFSVSIFGQNGNIHLTKSAKK